MEKGRATVRRIILFITIIFAFTAFVIMFRYMMAKAPTSITAQKTTALTPQVTTKPEKTVNFNSEQFTYAYFIVQNPAGLSLIPNFSGSVDTQTIISDHACLYAINGGFYDKQNKPLGFFQVGSEIYGPQIDSNLVNGFLWADATGSAVISTELPQIQFRFAVQTGPMLLVDSTVLPLAINNDTHARRMVAAKIMDNRLVFLTIYTGESAFEGPLLDDLPGVIQAVRIKENLNITDAVNLDGGSASAFYNEDTRLSELTPVGSIFCVK